MGVRGARGLYTLRFGGAREFLSAYGRLARNFTLNNKKELSHAYSLHHDAQPRHGCAIVIARQ